MLCLVMSLAVLAASHANTRQGHNACTHMHEPPEWLSLRFFSQNPINPSPPKSRERARGVTGAANKLVGHVQDRLILVSKERERACV